MSVLLLFLDQLDLMTRQPQESNFEFVRFGKLVHLAERQNRFAMRLALLIVD